MRTRFTPDTSCDFQSAARAIPFCELNQGLSRSRTRLRGYRSLQNAQAVAQCTRNEWSPFLSIHLLLRGQQNLLASLGEIGLWQGIVMRYASKGFNPGRFANRMETRSRRFTLELCCPRAVSGGHRSGICSARESGNAGGHEETPLKPQKRNHEP